MTAMVMITSQIMRTISQAELMKELSPEGDPASVTSPLPLGGPRGPGGPGNPLGPGGPPTEPGLPGIPFCPGGPGGP